MKSVSAVPEAQVEASATASSAAIAAQYADAVDQAGQLPVQALEALRAEGLLGLLVPRRFGGPELSLRAVTNICRRLAEGCASTGLIFAMHQSQAAVAIEHSGESEWHQQLLLRMAREQSLIASATTEGATGGSIRTSACFIDLKDNGLHLHKSGSVISYAHAADVFLVSARRSEDAAASDQQLVAVLREQLALESCGRWNPLGMRGACTDRFNLTAHCSAEQIFPGRFANVMSDTMLPSSHILLGSVWLGIAAAALGRAQAFLRNVYLCQE